MVMKMVAALAAFVYLAQPAFAAGECGSLGDVLGQLKAKYGEYPIAEAKTDDGHVLVILSGPNRKTYTAIVTFAEPGTVARPDGRVIACVLSSGTNWRIIPRYHVEESF